MTDFLIIGGGAAGLSLAAELSPHASVVLLEAENAIAYHSSGRSAAAYVPGYGDGVMQAMIRGSRAHFTAGGMLSPRGMMLLGRAGEEAAFEADFSENEMRAINMDEALARVPVLNTEAITQIGLSDEIFDIDADLLIQGFTKAARSHGTEIVTGARVTEIVQTPAGWQVTAGRTYAAKTLVNAAGAWASPVATMAGAQNIPITPKRRSMARVAGPDGIDVRNWPFLFGVGETWYAKPDAGALLISPAEQDPVEPMDAWADDMVLAEGISRYQAFVTAEVDRMIANWAGLRSFAPDKRFVLGRDDICPDFVWCAGQGGNGIQTAPMAARLLADVLLERDPLLGADMARAVSPARFV